MLTAYFARWSTVCYTYLLQNQSSDQGLDEVDPITTLIFIIYLLYHLHGYLTLDYLINVVFETFIVILNLSVEDRH